MYIDVLHCAQTWVDIHGGYTLRHGMRVDRDDGNVDARRDPENPD